MKKIILISIFFMFFAFSQSCITPPSPQPQSQTQTQTQHSRQIDIPSAFLNIYSNNQQNLDHLDIEAILKTFVAHANQTEYDQWSQFKNDENNYMSSLTTNTINPNYPIVPSSHDVQFSDNFLDALTQYYECQNYRPNESVRTLTTETTRLIFMINDFVYFNRKKENK